MKLITTIGLLLTSSMAFAAGGHGPEGIPWKLIGSQALNVTIMFGLLCYFLKSPAKTFFAARYESYNKKLEESQRALTAAQEKKDYIENSISEFKRTKEESLASAQTDSSELKNKMVSEAQRTADRIKSDSEAKIKIELESAKASLMDDLLERSVDTAKSKMKQELNPADYQRLKGEFVDKVQVVSAQ